MSLHSLLLATFALAADPSPEHVDKLATEALRAWDVPGAAVVIVTPERAINLKGYGVRELRGKPVTPDTVFPLASCTKAFTTALVAALADDGKLTWDDPVRRHLPAFHLSDPAADALVSLRDLGSHRTGVGPHDLLWYRAPWSQDEMVRKVGLLPLSRPFRSEMQYQSVMFVALGRAAARAGGKPWADLVRDRFLVPLGMKGVTLTTTEADKQADRAAGHRAGADGKLAVVPWYEQTEPNPAGSINASARDLVPWLRFQLAGGKLGDEVLVTEASLRETQSPQIVVRMRGEARALNPETQQISYGLGWVIQDYRGHLQVMHAGMIDGFRAHLTLLPKDGFAFAVLANREGTRMNLALSNALTDLLLGLPPRDWNKYLLDVEEEQRQAARIEARKAELARRSAPDPSVPRDKLAGTYTNPAYGPAVVRTGPDGLVWEWARWKLPLEHYTADTYRVKAEGNPYVDGVYVRFAVNDGEPREAILGDMRFTRTEK
jgi:CubicO group peptidase (beta-lactamase class C family)